MITVRCLIRMHGRTWLLGDFVRQAIRPRKCGGSVCSSTRLARVLISVLGCPAYLRVSLCCCWQTAAFAMRQAGDR